MHDHYIIIGLDPAGPYFRNTDPTVRLDSTDAEFVDAIHTDAESLVKFGAGILQPVMLQLIYIFTRL